MAFDSNTHWKYHNKKYKISLLHAQKILVLKELGSFKILEHHVF
jgi:hypothetical protein